MKIAKPSVQSLFIKMLFNGVELSSGTGFVVTTSKGSYLITNRHNVTGLDNLTGACLSKTAGIPNEILIVHNTENLGEWIEKKEQLLVGDVPRWIEHPKFGPQADFVALPLTDLDKVKLYPYDTFNNGPKIFLGPADSVSVVGFPFGISAAGAFAVWATGFLASDPIINFRNLPIQLIDCRSRQGQSGSPVIAYRSGGSVMTGIGSAAIFDGPVSNFIGIYSGRINSESDLGIVWKASALNELINIL